MENHGGNPISNEMPKKVRHKSGFRWFSHGTHLRNETGLDDGEFPPQVPVNAPFRSHHLPRNPMRLFTLLFLTLSASVALAAPPNKPVLTAVPTTGKAIQLTWTIPAGGATPTAYEVRRNGTLLTDPAITVTTFKDTDTNLVIGTSYSYVVRAYNGAESVDSDPVTATPIAVPASPTNLVASSPDNTKVVLTWTGVSGATTYTIYRDGADIGDATNTTFTDTDVEPLTTYRYTVTATNTIGESDDSNTATVTTKGDGSTRNAVWTRAFKLADANFDEVVTFEEYLLAYPNSLSEVIMDNRFRQSDDDGSGDLTVDEYILHFGGKTIKRPSKGQAFFLADKDEDGVLDPSEYALTLARGLPEPKVTKAFGKKDKNGTLTISQVEFGIRGGTTD